jgi:polynucleotide 5'-kinase involved in rRNA processing
MLAVSFLVVYVYLYLLGFAGCKKNDHQNLKEELERDFQHDFLSTCEATCNRLVELNKKYPQQFLDPEGAFAETQKQFHEKQILISVLGCHGSGKSTLLNALLDCTLVNALMYGCFKSTQ